MVDHLETIALHAGQENPGPGDRLAGSTDIPDYFFRFPRFRARRESFCTQGAGQYLYSHDESDDRCF